MGGGKCSRRLKMLMSNRRKNAQNCWIFGWRAGGNEAARRRDKESKRQREEESRSQREEETEGRGVSPPIAISCFTFVTFVAFVTFVTFVTNVTYDLLQSLHSHQSFHSRDSLHSRDSCSKFHSPVRLQNKM